MTPTNYTHIRRRLDHPRVIVWDGCAVSLPEDDPEWPSPTRTLRGGLVVGARRLHRDGDRVQQPVEERGALALPILVRMGLVAVIDVVRYRQPYADGVMLRDVSELVVALLQGDHLVETGLRHALERAEQQGDPSPPGMVLNVDGMAASCARLLIQSALLSMKKALMPLRSVGHDGWFVVIPT